MKSLNNANNNLQRLNEIGPDEIGDTFTAVYNHGGRYVQGGAAGGGDVNINILSNILSNNTKNVYGAASSGGNAAGLAFFSTPAFKLIGAGALAAGVIMLISKIANNMVKVRYMKCVKALQRAQRDFVFNPDGMSMRTLMPGIGNKIGDLFSKIWTLGFLGKKKSAASSNHNIGLHPFCNKYKEEIALDYKVAVDAFNKIALVNDQMKMKQGTSYETSTKWNGGEKINTKNGGTFKAESAGVVYRSFKEAINSGYLNESYGIRKDYKTNGILLEDISLGTMKAMGGQFKMFTMKPDGSPDPKSEKSVQVTKESVREICYSIIFNYMDKYVNMKALFSKLGIKPDDLSDINASSCEKLSKVLKQYANPSAASNNNKMFSRIHEAYDTMIKHYINIGNGLIDNFKKFTDAKDEKHANLVVAGEEKLRAMWDSQKDQFKNNFSHVLEEIISSNVYAGYLNFIIEQVLPVFNTGSAGDADYVLNVMPKKGQYYLVRQTGRDATGHGKNNTGNHSENAAIAKVLNFNEKTKIISIKILCLIQAGGYKVDPYNIATINPDADMDFDAFKGDNGKDRGAELPYNKWLALDPCIINNWSEVRPSDVFVQPSKKGKKKKNRKIVYCLIDNTSTEDSDNKDATVNKIIVSVYNVDLTTLISNTQININMNISQFNQMMQSLGYVIPDSDNEKESVNEIANNYVMMIPYETASTKPEEKEAKNEEEARKIIEDIGKVEKKKKKSTPKTTNIFERIVKLNETEYVEDVFAIICKNREDNPDNNNPNNDNPDNKNSSESVNYDYLAAYFLTEDDDNSEDGGSAGSEDGGESEPEDNTNDNGSGDNENDGNNDSDNSENDDKSKKSAFVASKDEKFKKYNVIQLTYIRRPKNSSYDNADDKNIVSGIVRIKDGTFEQFVREMNENGFEENTDSNALFNSINKLTVNAKRAQNEYDVSNIKAALEELEKMGGEDNADDSNSATKTTLLYYKNDNGTEKYIFGIIPVNTESIDSDNVQRLNELDDTSSEGGESQSASDDSGKGEQNKSDNSQEKQDNQQSNSDVKYSIVTPDEGKNAKVKMFCYIAKSKNGMTGYKIELNNEGISLSDVDTYIKRLGFAPQNADEKTGQLIGKLMGAGIQFKQLNSDTIENAFKQMGSQGGAKLDEEAEKLIVEYFREIFAHVNDNFGQKGFSTTIYSDQVVDRLATNKDIDIITKFGYDNKQNGIGTVEVSFGPLGSRIRRAFNFQMNKGEDGELVGFVIPGGKQITNLVNEFSTTMTEMVINMLQSKNWKNPETPKQNAETPKMDQNSVSVTYDISNAIAESYGGSSVTVNRSFDEYLYGYYVLSESVYDNGNGKRTGLDSFATRKRLMTRSDVMNYVKESVTAKIMPFDCEQEYVIEDNRGTLPSLASGLYESVILVKFDKNENVVSKMYLGNNKIA